MFANRTQAGHALAVELARRIATEPLFGGPAGERVVAALPRGGVPVAAEVALAIGAPLDLVLVRKIGLPWQPELAAAAIVDGDAPVLVRNDEVIRETGLPSEVLEVAAEAELAEIRRRRAHYLAGRPRRPLEGRVVIVIDDGIATGTTARAALTALRSQRPAALILAVPVAPPNGLRRLRAACDLAVVLERPDPFIATGAHYLDFGPVSDAEVRRHLDRAAQAVAPGQAPEGGPAEIRQKNSD